MRNDHRVRLDLMFMPILPRSLLKEDAVELESTEFGQKFAVRGSLAGPNDRSASIVTVWIILGSDAPRFVTAYAEN